MFIVMALACHCHLSVIKGAVNFRLALMTSKIKGDVNFRLALMTSNIA